MVVRSPQRRDGLLLRGPLRPGRAHSVAIKRGTSCAFVEPGDVAVAEFAAVAGLSGGRGWFVDVGVACDPADDEAVDVEDGAAARVGLGVFIATIGIIWMDPTDVFAATILKAGDIENVGHGT